MSEHEPLEPLDPFALLAALNPVPQLEEELATDDALLQSIVLGQVPYRRSVRRGRHLRLVGGAGLCLVLVAAAAFSFTTRRNPTAAVSSALCYSEVSHNPKVLAAVPTDGDPIASCRRAWQRGEFVEAGDPEVPSLLGGCVGPTGVLVVLPGGMTSCEQLGYPVWSGDVADDSYIALENAIRDWVAPQIRDGQCHTYDEGMAVAEAAIEHFQLSDWTIEVGERWVPNLDRPICTLAVPIGERKVMHVDFFLDNDLYLPGREP